MLFMLDGAKSLLTTCLWSYRKHTHAHTQIHTHTHIVHVLQHNSNTSSYSCIKHVNHSMCRGWLGTILLISNLVGACYVTNVALNRNMWHFYGNCSAIGCTNEDTKETTNTVKDKVLSNTGEIRREDCG